MATLTVIFLLLVLFHFIYESILLPMFRLEVRYNLFEIRDKLRSFEIENVTENNSQVIMLLDEMICITLNRLPAITLSGLFDTRHEISQNPKFNKRIDLYIEKINTSDPELTNVYNSLIRINTATFILNSGGWIYILLPIILLLVLSRQLRNGLYKILSALILLSDQKLSFGTKVAFN